MSAIQPCIGCTDWGPEHSFWRARQNPKATQGNRS